MRKKQHLIALDLDGTLLTDKKKISDKNKEIIKLLLADGHIVIIATGRPHRSSIHYYNTLGLKTPMVNFNGALIHHPYDINWGRFHHPLDYKTAINVIDASISSHARNIMAEVQDNSYLAIHDQEIIDVFQLTDEEKKLHPFTIGNLKENLKEDPTSILIRPDELHMDQLKGYLEGYVEFIEHRNWGAPFNIIEITKKGINKAIGLKQVADYYQIPTNRIIAFGDEDNDLEMINYAGIGVAMDNGISELKSIANHITASNEDSGVASFLSNYFKLKPNFIEK